MENRRPEILCLASILEEIVRLFSDDTSNRLRSTNEEDVVENIIVHKFLMYVSF